MSILRPEVQRPRESRAGDEPRAGRAEGGPRVADRTADAPRVGRAGARSHVRRTEGGPHAGRTEGKPSAGRSGAGSRAAGRTEGASRVAGADGKPRVGRTGGEPRDGRPEGKRRHHVLARTAAFVGRTVRGEWYGIVVDPLRELRRRGPAALLLAFVACAGVIFFHAIAQHPAGATAVRVLGGVQGDLPLWVALLRTPVSLYVPALDLPVWAGITQLFLAFALAELALGRRRTLLIAYGSTLAGTLTVRVMLAAGPGWWGLGLPPEVGQVLDTGPSAAVVGLFTYLSVVRHAPVVFVLTGGSMVWESIAKPNLAGREHLVAVAAALAMGLVHERGRRRREAATKVQDTVPV